MKKFAMFVMLLSVSLLTIGCQPSTPAKKPADTGKPAAEKPEGGAEKPAEPAAPK